VVSPESTATALKQKLDHLNTCQNLVNQHGLALQQAISQIEDSAKLKSLVKDPQVATLIKKTAEFRVASSSMIKVCSILLEGIYNLTNHGYLKHSWSPCPPMSP